jgi:hypothetical protein
MLLEVSEAEQKLKPSPSTRQFFKFAHSWLNNPTESRVNRLEGDPNRLCKDPSEVWQGSENGYRHDILKDSKS